MKTIKMRTFLAVFLLSAAVFSHAVDIEAVNSPQLIDRLLSFSQPAAPEIVDNMVVFTASSGLRRVGAAFADEGFGKVHWFRPLHTARDPRDIPVTEKKPYLYEDSGIVFYVHEIPEGASEIVYRLIIDGLWTTDPANPNSRLDPASGLSCSTIAVPPRETVPNPLKGPPGSLNFVFQGPPGETVAVAGNFNNWDPFMYELREYPEGNYTMSIPLPPGVYQYVFFHRGQRYLDPYNSKRVYTRDGKAASEMVIE
jgi:hypothetical protein